MKVVVDATPLIYLAKINRLSLLNYYTEIFIPGAVYNEAVEKGLEKGFFDSKVIQQVVEEKTFRVIELSKKQGQEATELMTFANIGAGEAQAIILARNLAAEVILDDLVAHGAAKTLGLEPLWMTSFILKLYGDKTLDKKEAREVIEGLVGAGYRISGDVLIEIFKILE